MVPEVVKGDRFNSCVDLGSSSQERAHAGPNFYFRNYEI